MKNKTIEIEGYDPDGLLYSIHLTEINKKVSIMTRSSYISNKINKKSWDEFIVNSEDAPKKWIKDVYTFSKSLSKYLNFKTTTELMCFASLRIAYRKILFHSDYKRIFEDRLYVTRSGSLFNPTSNKIYFLQKKEIIEYPHLCKELHELGFLYKLIIEEEDSKFEYYFIPFNLPKKNKCIKKSDLLKFMWFKRIQPSFQKAIEKYLDEIQGK